MADPTPTDRPRDPNAGDAPPFDADALMRLGRVGAVVPSPCGAWAAVSVERLDARHGARYVSDLWRVPLDGGEPRRLTVGEHQDKAPSFRADGALGFLSDRPLPGDDDGADDQGDDRRSQVWLLPAGGGEPRPITDEPLGVRAHRFAARGDRLIVAADVLPDVPAEAQRETARERAQRGPSLRRYTATPVRFWDRWRGPEETHLVAFDGAGGGRTDLTPDAGDALFDAPWDVSPDGAVVAVAAARMNPADRIFDRPLMLIDVAGGAQRELGAEAGVVHGAPRFSPDGAHVAASRYKRTPERYGDRTLWRYGVDGGEARELTAGWALWPEVHAWTRDGAAVIVTADDEARHPVFTVDATDGAIARVTAREAGGCHGEVAPLADGRRIVGLRHTRFHPPEVFTCPASGPATPTLVTSLSGLSEADGRAIATQRELRVDVGSGREVQCLVVAPRDEPASGRASFLWIHGGPVACWHDGWHWRWSPLVLAAAGHTVILPNPAGSTGFGAAWVNDIWGNVWGGRCYEDLMGVVDHLEAAEGLAAADMVAMGGSFGGYMTNWIGANTDRFAALVSHAGIFEMAAFHGVTDLPAWWSLMMGGAPYGDWERFDRYSPSRRVEAWRTPTLILHGDKDYRVPVGEALQLFEALQHHGVDSELIVFPDENHWILAPRNAVAWYAAVLDFVAARCA